MSEQKFDEEFSEVALENAELADDLDNINLSSVVVYSRDWTIETIYNQISQGNIELNPEFQRRNAWTDDKRSKLIESIIIGYPVPEIVLAEDPQKKRSFIVIDGKQRLLTVAGFIDNNIYKYWKNDKLSGLKVRQDLNKVTFTKLKEGVELKEEFREFNNASLRCTIITNFSSYDVLYDIFYRLNAGSVPLATQELRQVLYRGEFSKYLIQVTNSNQPIHRILNLSGPDKRLLDVEVLLRLFSIILFPNNYTGNLKVFLDNSLNRINQNWSNLSPVVFQKYIDINKAIEILKSIFSEYNVIGRKYSNSEFESRFNRVLFEVQVYFFTKIDIDVINDQNRKLFIDEFKILCKNPEFKSSLESTTKSLENYKIRFYAFSNLMRKVFSVYIQSPFNIPS